MPDDVAFPRAERAPGASIIQRPADDHYRSPPECLRALASVVDLSAGLHEFCAGDGTMAAVAADLIGTDRVTASTIAPPAQTYFPVEQADFLETTALRRPWLVSNPPYSMLGGRRLANAGAAVRIISHALQLLEEAGPDVGGLCCLMDVRFALSENRNEPGGLLYERPATFIHGFMDRVTMYPVDTPMDVKLNSGLSSYGWFVWQPPFHRPGAYSLFRSSLHSRSHQHDGDRERFRLPMIGNKG